ncbi:MAG: DUF2333 family protein [Dokdonella sp.]|uniref:DUF2333 family protein n=2 Tax=Dokdonella sp. TaxID=2291710 RepID=UPI0025BD67FF|nr:DUF2333 family protein [Dokdonella sp.]MBX3700185.1 DUF2333 family protein [Dokdonella sp.]
MKSWWWRGAGVVLLVYVAGVLALMWWWDYEPPHFDVAANAREVTGELGSASRAVTGSVTTAALITSAQTLLDKRGGYLSNDRLPPGVLMDNVPNWEFGVLTATRDLARALRNDLSRSQTQSVEDADLQEADPLFSSPNDRWLLPSSESQYRKAIGHLRAYLARLVGGGQGTAQFYARADNLADYLQVASARLGSLSQRLSAAAGQVRLDTTLAGDPHAQQSSATPPEQFVRTPWTKIDDNFYEARGYAWALREQLEAMRIDFAPILASKNATVSLEQIIRELEESQRALGSPVVLNGRPFGFFANHSLVMANYISRANAAMIDLRELLKRG